MAEGLLIYAFVAREKTVLAEYSPFTGNFSTVSLQYLEKLTPNKQKFIFPCSSYTLNFLIENKFTFMVMADTRTSRELVFGFLERIKEDFQKSFGSEIAQNALAHSLDGDYSPRLKYHMEYCEEHPEELDKLLKIKNQISQVKGIMMENIDKVLDRGEKFEILVNKSEDLLSQAQDFQRSGRRLRNRVWWDNIKIKLAICSVALFLILILWVSTCKGFVCK